MGKDRLEHEKNEHLNQKKTRISSLVETASWLKEPSDLIRVLVLPSDSESAGVFEDLAKILGSDHVQENVVLLPGFVQAGVFRYESARKTVAQRVAALRALSAGQTRLVIASARSLCRFVPKPDWVSANTKALHRGDFVELEELVLQLEKIGYLQVQAVEEVGDYAVRGAIVDAWIPGHTHPHRIEIFGDEVESIRMFRPADQRSFKESERVTILPCREFDWPKEARLEEALERLNAASLSQRLSGTTRADLFENLRQGVPFLGIDDACVLLFPEHYCSLEAHLSLIAGAQKKRLYFEVLGAPEAFRAALEDDQKLYAKAEQSAHNKGFFFTSYDKIFGTHAFESGKSFFSSKEQSKDLCSVQINLEMPSDVARILSSEACRKAKGRLEALAALLEQKPGTGPCKGSEKWVHRIFIGVKDPSSVAELRGFMSHCFSGFVSGVPQTSHDQNDAADLEEGLPASFFSQSFAAPYSVPEFFLGDTGEPFYSADSRILVVSESWLKGITHSISSLEKHSEGSLSDAHAKQASRTNAEILLQAQFSEFREGDPVVHVLHGVGRFLGLATVKIGDASGDFLVIEYAGKDKIYVPVDKMTLVQKYVSASSADNLVLDSLKSQAWEKKREKAKKDAEKIARQLLEHQAKRETSPGHSFARHDEDMMAFEAAFPFDETLDQLKSGREIADDMLAVKSMDRLLCGDVGFGKTEVAMRAAYRAILDTKQVAWLVPTTVLAHQHYRSACERFEGFGVNISLLDRSATKGLKHTLDQLEAGKIDLVIGTHRILSEDVQFKSLGLLVVDEEQRFGVLQKERIKNMSYGVDVLTMTATPIPRTLQMAMLGLRDLSLLTTPPKARLAVKTFVSPFDDEIIKQALETELARGGQSFFVHNRVDDLESVKVFLQNLVPGIRIAVGHGQLSQKDLDSIIIAFLDGKYDLLLCTTIIESGIDMPNVNTIIIQDADHFGLAQLYQLRGRVGRRSSRGYAYFLLSPGLTEKDDGYKRVEILKEHQGLGSGFVIASHDLEMRGAGNIVGDDQSGRVSDVGLETYNQMLDEAVKSLGGIKAISHRDVDLKLPLDVKIPEVYIQSPRERLRCYRKFFSAGTEEALQNLLAECEDRFGSMPREVKLLGEIARTKRLALRVNAVSLVVSNGGTEIRLGPEVLQGGAESEELVMRILDVCNRRAKDVRLTPDGRILMAWLKAADFRGEEIEKSFAKLHTFLSALAGDVLL